MFDDSEIQSVSISNSKFPKLLKKYPNWVYNSGDEGRKIWLAHITYKINYDCLMSGLYPNGKKIDLIDVEQCLSNSLEWLEPREIYFEMKGTNIHSKINQKTIQK